MKTKEKLLVLKIFNKIDIKIFKYLYRRKLNNLKILKYTFS